MEQAYERIVEQPILFTDPVEQEAPYQLTTAQRIYLPFKRLFDIVFSLLALIVLSPLFLVVAIIIKRDSPGPVFYKGERVGRNKEPFTMYKFRTMVVNADNWREMLSSEELEEMQKEFKLKNDPRVTHIGSKIRKVCIDEIPQFLNVLKGEMSLIGHRPPLIDEIEKYGQSLDLLLSAKPGLTGYWQVNGRHNVSHQERIRMQLHYAKNFSPAMDIDIFFKTFGVIAQGNGR